MPPAAGSAGLAAAGLPAIGAAPFRRLTGVFRARRGPGAGRVTAAVFLGLVTGPWIGGITLLSLFTAYATVPFGLGLVLLPRLPWALHGLAAPERARARHLLKADLPAAPARPPYARDRAGAWRAARDRQAWRESWWLGRLVLLGPLTFVLVAGLWGGPLFLLTLPLWTWSVDRWPLWLFTITTVPDALAVAVVGLLLLPLSALLVRAVGRRTGASAAYWLGPDVRERLEAKVADLERTRSIAVSAADSERRRLERDLHDGAQSRLVSLAVTLALAEEALERDPGRSRELLQEARGSAVTAVEELRSLARGLAPTVLRTRGLRAALDGLAATSPVPVRVHSEGYTHAARDEVESALYFAAAEALTNAAKHADAAEVRVDLMADSTGWLLEVRDDGRGGAVDAPGGGLAGLRDRLAPLDATLEVESGPGGTVVRVRA